MPIKIKDHFKDEWEDVFQIDSTSPSFLSWKINGNNKKVGRHVGWLTDSGHWKCEYKDKAIYVHRIVYKLQNGTLDSDMVVDHIDQVPRNNNPSNLRLVRTEVNFRNKKKGLNNISGINGVHEIHKFVATWSEDGKPRSKDFQVAKYGYEDAKRLAIEFRENKIEELNSSGYEYSDLHGK